MIFKKRQKTVVKSVWASSTLQVGLLCTHVYKSVYMCVRRDVSFYIVLTFYKAAPVFKRHRFYLDWSKIYIDNCEKGDIVDVSVES